MSALRCAVRDLVSVSVDIDVSDQDQRDRLRDAIGRVHQHATDAANALETHRKPDRSAVLRMAGNIAAGLVSDPQGWAYAAEEQARENIARMAVDLARRIMRITDEATP